MEFRDPAVRDAEPFILSALFSAFAQRRRIDLAVARFIPLSWPLAAFTGLFLFSLSIFYSGIALRYFIRRCRIN